MYVSSSLLSTIKSMLASVNIVIFNIENYMKTYENNSEKKIPFCVYFFIV